MATQDATPLDSGTYLFVDLDELDGVIGEWEDQGASIMDDGRELQGAAAYTESPADDVVTVGYFTALSDTFREFAMHNREMLKYTTTHIEKLSASRNSMAGTENALAAMFPYQERA